MSNVPSFTPEPAEHQSPPPSTTTLDEVNTAYLAELEVEKEKLEATQQEENTSATSSHLLRLLENGTSVFWKRKSE